MTIRSVVQGIQRQGIDESVIYNVTTTPWGSSPTTCSMGVWERVTGVWTNCTTATTTGALSTFGDVITLPQILSLNEGHTYRVITEFITGGQSLSCYFDVFGEK